MGHHIYDIYIPYSEKSFRRHLLYFFRNDGRVEGLSRKTKKAMLGRKWGKHELRKRIAAVVVTPRPYPETAELSDRFCPKCGCERTRSTGNMVGYPEVWVRSYCLRCGYLVSEADNSPEVHVLELMCGPDKDDWDPRYWG
jgi:hypothetical protein